MELLHQVIITLNDILWGPPMLVLLFGTHLFFTFRLRFIQRYTFKAIKMSVKPDKGSEGDVSQFAALATALAATIGTGNIVGVSTAIALGGPGAVFWCWLTGVFGISTKYAECLLAVKYRSKTSDGTMLGGPMYTLEKGLGKKWMARLFCVFTLLASFGIGCTVQCHAISAAMESTFGVPTIVTGVTVAIIIGFVILGGVKKIASVCEKLVPFMALFYIVGCVIILMINYQYIFPAIGLIVRSAFTPQAAASGFVGSTIIVAAKRGIARGLFSNESGLGSAPIAAAAAQTKNPVRQALVSMTGTFWDTVVVCAMTGIVIVSSILKNPQLAAGANADELTRMAFKQLSGVGPYILNIALIVFAFTTILGWSYYGEKSMDYLMGKRGILYYRYIFLIVLIIGAVTSLQIVWDFADCVNALMAIPNLIGVLALSKVIVSETKKYLWENRLEECVQEEESTAEKNLLP